MLHGGTKGSHRISHTNSTTLKICSALPGSSPKAPGKDARAAFSSSELKLAVIGCSGWCLHDNLRARILGQGADGKIPNMRLLSEMTKLPSSPPGLVTAESCLSDMNCNPKVITQGQGIDEKGCTITSDHFSWRHGDFYG